MEIKYRLVGLLSLLPTTIENKDEIYITRQFYLGKPVAKT